MNFIERHQIAFISIPFILSLYVGIKKVIGVLSSASKLFDKLINFRERLTAYSKLTWFGIVVFCLDFGRAWRRGGVVAGGQTVP